MKAPNKDSLCTQLKRFCFEGWPEPHKLKSEIKLYRNVAPELTVCDDLLLIGCRTVIPPPMRTEMLHCVHEAHHGIETCRLRAKRSIWWSGLSKDIQKVVDSCTIYCKEHASQREPMISTEYPSYPWEKVGTDLFHWKGMEYLLVVDYFSRYIEIA